MRFGQPFDTRYLFAFLFGVHHINGQVWPVEAADECFRFQQSQLFDYVGTHVRCGRSSERERLHVSQERDDVLQTQVVGTKIVAPG